MCNSVLYQVAIRLLRRHVRSLVGVIRRYSHLPNRFSSRTRVCSLTHERRKSLRSAKLFVSAVVSLYDARVQNATEGAKPTSDEDFCAKYSALVSIYVILLFKCRNCVERALLYFFMQKCKIALCVTFVKRLLQKKDVNEN